MTKLPVSKYKPDGDIPGNREVAAGDDHSEEEMTRVPPNRFPAASPRKTPQGLSMVKHLSLNLTLTTGFCKCCGLLGQHIMAEFSRMVL